MTRAKWFTITILNLFYQNRATYNNLWLGNLVLLIRSIFHNVHMKIPRAATSSSKQKHSQYQCSKIWHDNIFEHFRIHVPLNFFSTSFPCYHLSLRLKTERSGRRKCFFLSLKISFLCRGKWYFSSGFLWYLQEVFQLFHALLITVFGNNFFCIYKKWKQLLIIWLH